MNDYQDIEQIKEDFWQKIRPKSKKEIEDEAMIVRVKDHFDKLIDDLLKEDGFDCSPGRVSKTKRFQQIKEEMDSFILGLNNANN